MYLWRVPLTAFIAWRTAALLVLAVMSLMRARRVRTAAVWRAVFAALSIVIILISPSAVAWMIVAAQRDPSIHRVFVDPSPIVLWSPSILVCLLIGVNELFFPRRVSPLQSDAWRSAYAAIVVSFAFLNVANWCSPGWCERFGFPFAYSWWSDAIIVMNGQNLTAGSSMIAAVLNACVLIGIGAVLSLRYRRNVTRV